MFPHIQNTLPEVFILESLTLNDERNGRFEGKVLADVLRMCGKSPEYYYFRTEQELTALAQEFRKSGFRFLHLSCHGSYKTIETTYTSVPYNKFAEIFTGFLQNRRLFVSACEVGNEIFTAMVSAKNKGMYSIACPSVPIRFDVSVALWSALYVRTFLTNENYVKGVNIYLALQSLCALFEVPFYWSWYHPKEDKWINQTIEGKSITPIGADIQKIAAADAD
jgi:hypothetical protein